MAKVEPAKFTGKPAQVDGVNPVLPEPDYDLEIQKARGQTESQKAIRKYHETEFQKNDPVTGEKREDGDKVLADTKKDK